MTLFAWSLLGILAWAAILVLARDGFKPALRLALLGGAAAAAAIGAFSLATGFDPVGALHATSRVYELGSPPAARTRSGCSARRSHSCSCSARRSPGSR